MYSIRFNSCRGYHNKLYQQVEERKKKDMSSSVLLSARMSIVLKDLFITHPNLYKDVGVRIHIRLFALSHMPLTEVVDFSCGI